MTQDNAALYNAYASRNPRFDGVFYVGVTSTGIYCRPICTAKTPKATNCRFFNSAEAAEKASFRRNPHQKSFQDATGLQP